jgi:hypothetical protein
MCSGMMQVGVTHSRGGDLNQHLPRPWTRGGHLLDTQRLSDGVQHRSPHRTSLTPVLASGCCEANSPLSGGGVLCDVLDCLGQQLVAFGRGVDVAGPVGKLDEQARGAR